MTEKNSDSNIFKNRDPDPYTRTVTHPDEKILDSSDQPDKGQEEAEKYSSDSYIPEIVNEARRGLKDKTK